MLGGEKYATKEPVWSFSEAFQPFSIFSFSFFQEKQQVLMYPPGPDPRCRYAAPLCQQPQSFLEVKKENHCETWKNSGYSQLSSCGHPAITDTPIIRTAAKFPAKTN